MTGVKPNWLELINLLDMKGFGDPSYILYKLREIYQILEDVHSVASMTELQEAVDSIGDGAGTIFIESGTHIVDTPIDIDGGGSLVIYGHGNNTILETIDGVNVFNITDCASLTIKNLKIDATAYTGATSSVIVNETNDNVISFQDVTIIGNNFGVGIELISNNCMIEHCNISQLQDGIYLNNSNRHIITQNLINNNALYGINLDTSLYSSINGNIFNSNLTGIFVSNSTNNSISNNICNLNTENGIYITGSSYNTLSGNTCENNDSNIVGNTAGMYITNNSNFNTISGNSLNNNNNIGAGDGFGLIIATATCEENVVASNNYNGNDIDIHDVGVGTTVEYYVQNVDELQDAINSIGSGAGIININSSFDVSVTIIIDKNGSYLIEGEGDNTVLTTIGDISCFNIDIARQVVFRNFKINASSLTTPAKEIIDVNENNDNLIVFDNVSITGDGTHGYGIELNSNNCRINNCNIDNVNIGINILSTDNMLQGNKTLNCNAYGIQISANNNMLNTNTFNNNKVGIYLNAGNNNLIIGNYCESNTEWGINLNDSNYNSIPNNYCINNDGNSANPIGGIGVNGNSDNNMLIGNTSIDNNNVGVEDGYGICLGVNTDDNNILANWLSGNDDNQKDLGNNTTFSIAGHLHDGDTLKLDNINSNGGVFDFSTTGQVNFNQNISVPNLITAGNVDGVDVSVLKTAHDNLKTDVDGFPDRLKFLTLAEINQLENIDLKTISNAQWGYLGALDQALSQASSPKFAGLTLNAGITATKIVDEDDMVSDSNVYLSTQQSIKAYFLSRLLNIGFSSNWSGVIDKAITADKVYDQFVEVANEMTALKYCLNFEGVWDATSGNPPDLTPADGDYWIITTAGNWNGVDWELLDWIVWEATSAKWYKVKYFRQFPVVEVSGNKSIQSAIDQVIYMGGGIVKIHSGTFNDGNDVFPLTINDGGAGYFLKIVGVGDTTILDPNGDSTIFSITNIGKLVLEDFKIDANDLTTLTKEIIDITETSNNPITIRSITITGDGINGYGIEVNSDNCKVEGCDISSINIGINILGNDNTIQENTISSCNNYGIQIKGNKNSLYDNESDNNSVGIYLDTGDYNQINGNYIEGNTLNGIYLTGSNYNALNDNYCIGNDSNTGNPQAGIVIDADSDNNTIISNTSINNNNAGAGKSYGILINNANCSKNTINANKCSGNDIQYWDLGTNTDIEYRCSTVAEIQDAIDSIAAKSGVVHILPIAGGIQLTATINVNLGGDYVIEGEGIGSLIDCAGDRTAFNITNAKSCILENLKIDASDVTTAGQPIIQINEVNDNIITIKSVNIIGTGNGFGIYVVSDYCKIKDCTIKNVYDGIRCNPGHYSIISGNHFECQRGAVLSTTTFAMFSNNICISSGISGIVILGSSNNIIGNSIYNCVGGIEISSGTKNTITGNNISNCATGINVVSSSYNTIVANTISDKTIVNANNVGGIWIKNNSDYNIISGNILYNLTNTGAGLFYGIMIDGVTENNNKIAPNQFSVCDGDIFDGGTNTTIHGDNTVYGIGWNGDLGTPTKNAVYDAFTSFPIGFQGNYFGTGIKGVIGTRDYEISIVNGDDFDMLGWFVANNQAGTPDCLDKFVRNEATSGVVGGSDDAVVVSHTHNISLRQVSGTSRHGIPEDVGNCIWFSGIIDNTGVSGVNKNIPRKISAIPIIKMS